MSSYCLKCEKNTENINPRVLGTNNDKIVLNVLYVVIKNQDLLKNKKQVEY